MAWLRVRGEQVASLGLLDIWPSETQNWQEKEVSGLGPEVLVEINREREALPAAQQGGISTELFTAIEDNYVDAARLLTTAHSVPFDGKATLFVTKRTLQEGMSLERAWSPWVTELDIYRQDCVHVDIISPGVFAKIGPIIRVTLNR